MNSTVTTTQTEIRLQVRRVHIHWERDSALPPEALQQVPPQER
jgi:hypothetical protein